MRALLTGKRVIHSGDRVRIEISIVGSNRNLGNDWLRVREVMESVHSAIRRTISLAVTKVGSMTNNKDEDVTCRADRFVLGCLRSLHIRSCHFLCQLKNNWFSKLKKVTSRLKYKDVGAKDVARVSPEVYYVTGRHSMLKVVQQILNALVSSQEAWFLERYPDWLWTKKTHTRSQYIDWMGLDRIPDLVLARGHGVTGDYNDIIKRLEETLPNRCREWIPNASHRFQATPVNNVLEVDPRKGHQRATIDLKLPLELALRRFPEMRGIFNKCVPEEYKEYVSHMFVMIMTKEFHIPPYVEDTGMFVIAVPVMGDLWVGTVDRFMGMDICESIPGKSEAEAAQEWVKMQKDVAMYKSCNVTASEGDVLFWSAKCYHGEVALSPAIILGFEVMVPIRSKLSPETQAFVDWTTAEVAKHGDGRQTKNARRVKLRAQRAAVKKRKRSSRGDVVEVVDIEEEEASQSDIADTVPIEQTKKTSNDVVSNEEKGEEKDDAEPKVQLHQSMETEDPVVPVTTSAKTDPKEDVGVDGSKPKESKEDVGVDDSNEESRVRVTERNKAVARLKRLQVSLDDIEKAIETLSRLKMSTQEAEEQRKKILEEMASIESRSGDCHDPVGTGSEVSNAGVTGETTQGPVVNEPSPTAEAEGSNPSKVNRVQPKRGVGQTQEVEKSQRVHGKNPQQAEGEKPAGASASKKI